MFTEKGGGVAVMVNQNSGLNPACGQLGLGRQPGISPLRGG
jgi:hypothetical protein